MQIQTLKGFRDFLPAEKRKRDFVAKKIKEVFELYGFDPLETPTLEYADLLLGKYGDEADKLVYTFEDKGGRKVGLRYDQTVPTARILAQYNSTIPQYFRRYQMQNVFRADKPQKGRYREFTQCDADIFGSTSSLADAEILSLAYSIFKNIGYPNIIIKINDRQTLFKTLKPFETPSVSIFSIIQSIDKLDKQTEIEVIEELINKGLSKDNAEKSLIAIQNSKISDNLNEIITKTTNLGVPTESIEFLPTLARGLDYYTGIIFEISVLQHTSYSLGGGGRFDNLIEQLSKNKIPAVGFGLGFDRMVEAADELDLFPKKNMQTSNILVTIFNKNLEQKSLEISSRLRSNKINTELWMGEIKDKNPLEKQLKYADSKNIPYVLIIGPEEIEKNIYTLKNLTTRKQTQGSFDELIKILQYK